MTASKARPDIPAPNSPEALGLTFLAALTVATHVQPLAPAPGLTEAFLAELRDVVEFSVSTGVPLDLDLKEAHALMAALVITLALVEAEDVHLTGPPDLLATATAPHLKAAIEDLEAKLQQPVRVVPQA